MPKCLDCGFLAVRDCYSNEICEATPRSREKGEFLSSEGKTTPANFFCYQSCKQFPECNSVEKSEKVRRLDLTIKCDKFVSWREGRTPKEHEQMTFMEQVQIQQKAFQDQQIQFQDQQIEFQNLQVEQRNSEIQFQRQSQRTNNCLTIITIVVSLISAIAAWVAIILSLYV